MLLALVITACTIACPLGALGALCAWAIAHPGGRIDRWLDRRISYGGRRERFLDRVFRIGT